ncbi:MAG: zinc transporter ZupT [Candidatus Thermoplasmatota archaeon]|nr:zinc transporter ZupT [Euryarchaeota archaeon]MBU4032584.1 zinc transporter ZupT [Candidatus Thermoplasmatota archaeon]MBU4070951.1 zinc transporter ZupT [Candidatus Thermoplasmatota archaeon]MBU4144155.1 zinc transporter ZupT [Candidatus Thermoplasmatota archaeon]MBU4591749.1 zinc transporter ZupT [Candidatus Thermoplasmatota archaeon]
MDIVIMALLLSTFAGLSTVIGGLLAFVIKRPRRYFLPFSLGLSAGVMLYISFVELFPHALAEIGEFKTALAFFGGMVFIAIIDLIIPEMENPHHFQDGRGGHGKGHGRCRTSKAACNSAMMRTGMFTALAITIHNFPEGIATFATALNDINLGVVIALAIALHNIPEGISVSVPVYCATGSKKLALKYSAISGLAEPLGAIIAYLVLMPFLNDALLSVLLAAVAGIMVYISVDEIIPAAYSYGKSHIVVIGVILGMAVMAFSLMVL